jgi:hypothetical protein
MQIAQRLLRQPADAFASARALAQQRSYVAPPGLRSRASDASACLSGAVSVTMDATPAIQFYRTINKTPPLGETC